MRVCAAVVMLLWGAVAMAAPAPVLLIRSGPCEYEAALRQLGVPYRAGSSLRALEGLSAGRVPTVIVCALRYPRPNVLTPGQRRALERFVRAGGHALVEFTTARDAPLFGIPLPTEPERAFFERLFVVGQHPVTDPLGPGALLEEHNSACLPCTPPREARRLLEYGRVLGTYHVFQRDPGLEIVLDLQEPRHLKRVVQRYGAAEPNYCPERVSIATSRDGKEWHERKVVSGDPLLPAVLEATLDAPDSRYVRFRIVKYRRSPVTDFLFVGETQVFDAAGRNVALGQHYTLSQTPAGTYGDPGGLLTDGVIEGHWREQQAPGWVVPEPPQERQFPGLIELPYGKGQVLLALTKVSDFRARRYRLTARWETLLRQMALWALPAAERTRAQRRYLPLMAHTEPRRWQVPGEPVRLVVATAPGATVRAEAPGLKLPPPRPLGGGRFAVEFTPPAGHYRLRVRAERAGQVREVGVSLAVTPRRERYRQALAASLRWFRRSGVLPAADGSAGVYSQRCLAWLDGGPWDGGPNDFLPNPQRLDCNAATAVAFQLFGEVTGDASCLAVARNIADSLLPEQYADPTKPSFGGWPWLREKSDTIWFWDDNTRVATALLWLHGKTGDARYLEAGLRTMELSRQVAVEDGCIARHAIEPGELDALGRAGYRTFRQAVAPDFDLVRLAWAAGVTGDPLYRDALRTCVEARGHQAGARGLPYALYVLEDASLHQRLVGIWQEYLKDPDVRRFGVPRTGPGDFQYAFTNDCSISTEGGEPLTDQLYTVPHLLLHAWAAYKATGDATCRQAFERIGDYLVRIQSRDPDPRLGGAWMRGFDLDAWEEYGANYDPAYGPYSAYTGWMNAFTAIGFALYLSDQSPFPERGADLTAARAVLARVRAQEPPDKVRTENVALRRPYTIAPLPLPEYGDAGGELTDGVVDGFYQDQRSVGWRLEAGETLAVTVTVDLGETRTLGLVAQRYGATVPTYTPDTVELLVSEDGEQFQRVAQCAFGPSAVGSLWLPLPEGTRARWLRFGLTKTCRGPGEDFLFVGETQAFEAR